jgi:hypothetical protein
MVLWHSRDAWLPSLVAVRCRGDRSKAFPDGKPAAELSGHSLRVLAASNALTERVFDLAVRAAAHGIGVSIENPNGSVLWHTAAFLAFKHAARPCVYKFDMCRFGCRYKKRTALWSTIDLSPLARLCRCKRQHVRVSGWVDYAGQVAIPTKKGTAAYPPRLCRLWAQALAGHFPGRACAAGQKCSWWADEVWVCW